MTRAPVNSFHPRIRSAWRAWLKKHHARSSGVWVVSFKKSTGKPRLEYAVAVEEALCFGWIDSKPRKLDADRSMLWFAPRKSGTGWSRANKERIGRLVRGGLMTEAGLEKVRAAREDGSWNALNAVEALRVPDDLRLALARRRAATRNFAMFPRSVRRSILEWILNAKKPDTRAARIFETATLAQRNRRANQWRAKVPRRKHP